MMSIKEIVIPIKGARGETHVIRMTTVLRWALMLAAWAVVCYPLVRFVMVGE